MIDCTKCWNYEECVCYPDDMDECASHDWDRYSEIGEEENNEDQQLQPEEFVNEMDEEDDDENNEMEEEEEVDDKEFKKIDYNENNFLCIDL